MKRQDHSPARRIGIGFAVAAIAILCVPAAAADHRGDQTRDSIEVSPKAGIVGSQVTVSGDIGCARPDEKIVLLGVADRNADLTTRISLGFTNLTNGRFSQTITIPSELIQSSSIFHPGEDATPVPVKPGKYTIEALCGAIGINPFVYTTEFTVTAEPPPAVPPTTTSTTTPTTAPRTDTSGLTPVPEPFTPPLAPPSGSVPFANQRSVIVAQGAAIDIGEGGFGPAEVVQVVLYSSPMILAPLTADQSGTVTGQVTVEASVPIGSHTLVLFSERTIKSLPIIVTAKAGPGDSTGRPTSPDSGPGRLTFTG